MSWAKQQLEIQNAEVAAGKRKSVDVGLAQQVAGEERAAAWAQDQHRRRAEDAAKEQSMLHQIGRAHV